LLVLEYEQGATLSEFVKVNHKKLGPFEIAQLLLQIARGLMFVDKKGVLPLTISSGYRFTQV
jgi:serine/threonine protein kinase